MNMQSCFPRVTNKQPFQDHKTWIMNVQNRVFPSITDEWPFQGHILSETTKLTSWTLFPGRFPSVTDEQPFQDHLLRKTIIQTWSPLSPRNPEYWLSLYNPYIKTVETRCNMTSLVTWHHQQCHWHYAMPTALSMPLLCSLGKGMEMRSNMISLVTWYHQQWHWHHVMPTALSMLLLYSLGKKIEMRSKKTFCSCDGVSIGIM